MKTSIMLTNATSYHGMPLNEISSGLQKSIRRSNLTNGIWYILEWLLFKELPSPIQSHAILTNLRNRLLEVILWEDIVGFVQPWLIYEIQQHFDSWEKSDRDVLKGGFEIYNALLKINKWSRKCRFASDIRAQFGNNLDIEQRKQTLDSEFDKFRNKMIKHSENKDNIFTYPKIDYDIFTHLFMIIDDTKIMRKVWKLIYSYVNNDQFVNNFGSYFGDNVSIITSLYNKDHLKLINYLQCLFFKNLKRKEKFLYVVHAIYSLIHVGDIEFTKPPEEDNNNPFIQSLDLQGWQTIIENHKQKSNTHELEDYALDMHTTRGRKMKRNGIHFIEHGMICLPEDTEYLNIAWRNKYIELKRLNPERTITKSKMKSKVIESNINYDTKKSLNIKDLMNSLIKKQNKRKQIDTSDSENTSSVYSESNNNSNQGGHSPSSSRKEKLKQYQKDSNKRFKSEFNQILQKIQQTIPATQILTLTELNEAKKNNYLGQTVTGKKKQIQLLTKNFVYKGPFDLNVGQVSKRIIRTIDRYQYFQQLNIAVATMQILWEEGKIGQILWIKSEQLGNKDVSKWKIEKIEDNMTNGMSGSVIERRSMGLEIGSSITMDEWKQNINSMIELLVILMTRYILEPPVGDSAAWNCLVRLSDLKVYCIDYEEEWGIVEEYDEQVTTIQDWYKPISSRPHAWSKERILLFETILGLGLESQGFENRMTNRNLLIRWGEIKMNLEHYNIPYSSTRLSRMDFILYKKRNKKNNNCNNTPSNIHNMDEIS